MDGDLRQCGGPRRRVGAVSDVVSPPARAGRRPRRGADDPAIRLPQDCCPALRHRAASGGPPLDGGPLRRRTAVSARGLRCRGGRHRGAHRPLRPAGGAASSPVAAAFSARHGPLGRAPGKLAQAAGHPEHREPPSAGGQAPLCRHSGRASRKAVPALLPAVDGAAVHGAGYRTHLLAGAAPDVADPLCLQRPAQRGGHGFGGDSLPAGVQQLPPRCFVHEPADVLPAGQLLRRLCGKRRRLCAGAAAAKPRMTL